MRIAVIGTGYVGLVAGTGLAENGHTVTCVDRNPDVIESLNQGVLPIYEPGLEELVARNLEEERLRFSTSLAEAVNEALLVFVCVGTPTRDDQSLDTAEVMAAAEEVAGAMTGYRIIVLKSTCPVGTAERVKARLTELAAHPFDVVVNPEFLKEGAAVDDFMRPDRVVVGCDDVRVEEIMKELYAPFLRTGKPFLTMSLRSAEMSKLAVNAMLAARISVMNELAAICAAYGADVTEVTQSLANDERIGPTFLFPGVGYGGSCLPKDVLGCSRMAAQAGASHVLLDAVAEVNKQQGTRFIEHILSYYGPDITGKRIAVWGATFKPRTDDLRGAPALRVIDCLLDAGAQVTVYDPVAGPKLRSLYGERIGITTKNYAALEEADGLVIVTEWNEFRRPDYERMASLMRECVIFDGRNLYTPKVVARHGFTYFSIGRPPGQPGEQSANGGMGPVPSEGTP